MSGDADDGASGASDADAAVDGGADADDGASGASDADAAVDGGADADGGPAVRRLSAWDADDLRPLADAYGTPLYVDDRSRVRENYARLAEAFPDAEVLFAMKANAGGHVLRTLRDAGAGAECASAGELARALDAGFDPADVHYTAVNPPDADLDYARRVADEHPALTVTAGARDTVERLAERGFAGRFCLRVHPGVGAGHSESVSTGKDAKFGVPADEAVDVLDRAAEHGFDVVGLHAHAGSGITNDQLDDHERVVSTLADVARESGRDFEFVDVGGGFGVPYREREDALDLDRVAERTRDALTGVDATLMVEPGRYLVADAGVLLTEVNTVKRVGGAVIAGADAGMTTLVRPAMYGSYHPIRSLVEESRATEEVSVVGPVCESTDVLGEARDLPAPERGDLLAVGNAGAYGVEMASNYNSRPRPAVVALDDEGEELVRRRETLADVTHAEDTAGTYPDP
ncbi:diaminopimelate decarboxylase [Halarchaeum rubridurum]|uniref:Diaminopimelate decarboxylase n=1 Tax=Halarchaeum rubridurum TaxID=489911 RepID=A0A830G1P2_9EURY|nr:diaminopimelate decarboxylase [Halarchaeum rubridurum]MBP1955305.1 diaminopimelate decarboxylase [Halarchaeum rubridurum]GGM71162.1 diaminopimelate decarboxylase [Halarchaeum rubridurum]